MRHSKPKRFTYWQARFTTEPNKETLQQLLHSTFAGTKVGERLSQRKPISSGGNTPAFDNTKIEERLWPTDEEENYHYFINRYFVNYKAMRPRFFCANFLGYEKGKIGQGIKEAFDKDQIDITALPAPKAADGKEQQYLDGKLYFVCSGNHVILSQDAHLKAKRLEQYLNEMFHKRCDGFPENQQLILVNISRKSKEKIKGAKKINLSRRLEYTPKISDQKQLQIVKEIPDGRLWKAIKVFCGDMIDFTQFEMDGITDPKEIKGTLSLSWKKKRKEPDSDQFDSFTNAFRHVGNEMDFEVETKSGKIKGNDLRLFTLKSVEHNKDDMPIDTDIFDKMIEWYRHLVKAEDI